MFYMIREQDNSIIAVSENLVEETRGGQLGMFLTDRNIFCKFGIGSNYVESPAVLPDGVIAENLPDKYKIVDDVISVNENYVEPISDEELLLQTGDDILDGGV